MSASKYQPLPPFDIFRTDPEGVLWIRSAATLESAKECVQQLAMRSPGEYLLLNQVTGDKLTIKPHVVASASPIVQTKNIFVHVHARFPLGAPMPSQTAGYGEIPAGISSGIA
jgi:hypothetical protein